MLQTLVLNFGASKVWSQNQVFFFLFPLNLPKFNAKLWSTREQKTSHSSKVRHQTLECWEVFQALECQKEKNLSAFQNLTPNIGAPKGFSSFGGLRGEKTSQHSKVWHQTLKHWKLLVEFHRGVKVKAWVLKPWGIWTNWWLHYYYNLNSPLFSSFI